MKKLCIQSRFFFVSFLALISFFPSYGFARTSLVKEVRFQEHPEFIRLVEERSVKAGFRSELLHSPDRLYADIKKSNISEAGMKKIAVDNGHLLAIQGGRVYGYTSSNVCELDGVDKIAKYEMYAENNAANVIPDIYNTEVTGAVRKTERKPSIRQRAIRRTVRAYCDGSRTCFGRKLSLPLLLLKKKRLSRRAKSI
jgi:hypothetical protein